MYLADAFAATTEADRSVTLLLFLFISFKKRLHALRPWPDGGSNAFAFKAFNSAFFFCSSVRTFLTGFLAFFALGFATFFTGFLTGFLALVFGLALVALVAVVFAAVLGFGFATVLVAVAVAYERGKEMAS